MNSCIAINSDKYIFRTKRRVTVKSYTNEMQRGTIRNMNIKRSSALLQLLNGLYNNFFYYYYRVSVTSTSLTFTSIHSVIISRYLAYSHFIFVAYRFNDQSFVIALIRNYQICLSFLY